MPIVSIIMPTYNRSTLLLEAIHSAQAQNFKDWELIVVDDGSSDNTAEVVKEIAVEDSRIRYERQSNTGVSGARNRGMELTSGKFIAFLDDDDTWLPEKLAIQVEYLRQNPEVGLVSGQVRLTGRATGKQLIDPVDPGLTFKDLFRSNHIRTSTVMLRRGCAEQIGGFRKQYRISQDFDYWLRISRIFRIAFIARPMAVYGQQGDNLTGSLVEMYEDHTRVLVDTPPEPALGVTAGFKRQITARYEYRLARLCAEAGRSREAAGHFMRAIGQDTRVGLSIDKKTLSFTNGFRAGMRPYGGVIWYGLRGLAEGCRTHFFRGDRAKAEELV